MKTFTVALLFVILQPAAGNANVDAPRCGQRTEIIKMLSDKYREEPRAFGIANGTSLIEVFTSKTGSWTILVTNPHGSSCVVGVGQSWEDLPEPKEFTAL